MKKIRIGIIGAVGYTGFMLMKLLAYHPNAELVYATSREESGKKASDIYPSLGAAYGDFRYCDPSEADPKKTDAVFTALPHTVGASLGGKFADAGVKLIDLSADFRYDSLELYESTYGVTHPRADLLKEAVYGLCEWNREKIKSARIVGNPGCYTSAAILALKPLIEEKLIDPNGIIIDGKSGITGAGRKGDISYSLCECSDNLKIYSAVGHRHTSEMEEKLSASVSFTPHLLPIKRGIMQTIYARLVTGDLSLIDAAYEKYYKSERFVTYTGASLPEIKHVRGSNCCRIGAVVDKRLKLLKIVSVIDNLIKGASGSAVQNMNIMFGLDEGLGLPLIGEHL